MGHLPFSPNDDKFDGTVGYWYESFTTALGFIKNHEVIEIDRRRIKKAFKMIRPKLDRWPTPFQVIDIMPPRPAQKFLNHDPRQHEDQSESVLGKMSQALCDLSEGAINKKDFDEIMKELQS